MTEEKKVITIDDVEYTEDQLTDEAKACINHIGSLDQKIASSQFNLTQLQVGRQAFMDRLKEQLDNGQTDSAVGT
jgi:septal ring factor EnvC (AmiA/AmiB activator)